jgi:hypothetical protein
MNSLNYITTFTVLNSYLNEDGIGSFTKVFFDEEELISNIFIFFKQCYYNSNCKVVINLVKVEKTIWKF